MSPDLLQKYLKILIACHNKTAHNFSIFVYALGNQQKNHILKLMRDEQLKEKGEMKMNCTTHNLLERHEKKAFWKYVNILKTSCSAAWFSFFLIP